MPFVIKSFFWLKFQYITLWWCCFWPKYQYTTPWCCCISHYLQWIWQTTFHISSDCWEHTCSASDWDWCLAPWHQLQIIRLTYILYSLIIVSFLKLLSICWTAVNHHLTVSLRFWVSEVLMYHLTIFNMLLPKRVFPVWCFGTNHKQWKQHKKAHVPVLTTGK